MGERLVVSLTKRAVGRLAATLLLVGGCVTLITAPLAAPTDRVPLFALGGFAEAVGAWAWYAPWDRWSPRASLWLLVPVFLLLDLGDIFAGADPYIFGIYFVVVFAWIGVCHPPLTSFRVGPAAAIAYIAPLLLPGHGPTAIPSILQVMPVCLAVGEGVSRLPTSLRQAEEADLRRVADMRGLVDATEDLAKRSDPGSAMEVAAARARALLGGDGALALEAETTGGFATTAVLDWPGAPEKVEPGEEPEMELAIHKTVVELVHPRGSEGLLFGSGAFRTVVFVPLATSTGALGCLAVGSREDRQALDPFTSYLVQTFAAHAALTVERLQAVRLLAEASLHDDLTGLGNRRSVEGGLSGLRAGDAIVVADLDRFKRLNDSRGHLAGDHALRAFAHHVTDSLRQEDWAARLGGDEFLIVLPEAGAEAGSIVRRLAEAWRRALPATTFSAGIAVHRSGSPPGETLERADRALYEAKRQGRDRVVRL
jgi:diguanylate cyclase (GGDEF)-like protein